MKNKIFSFNAIKKQKKIPQAIPISSHGNVKNTNSVGINTSSTPSSISLKDTNIDEINDQLGSVRSLNEFEHVTAEQETENNHRFCYQKLHDQQVEILEEVRYQEYEDLKVNEVAEHGTDTNNGSSYQTACHQHQENRVESSSEQDNDNRSFYHQDTFDEEEEGNSNLDENKKLLEKENMLLDMLLRDMCEDGEHQKVF